MNKYLNVVYFRMAMFAAHFSPFVVLLIDRISHMLGFGCVGH